jgi:hypothetical protein
MLFSVVGRIYYVSRFTVITGPVRSPMITQHALEIEVKNLGAHLNAYTSHEHLVYYAKRTSCRPSTLYGRGLLTLLTIICAFLP